MRIYFLSVPIGRWCFFLLGTDSFQCIVLNLYYGYLRFYGWGFQKRIVECLLAGRWTLYFHFLCFPLFLFSLSNLARLLFFLRFLLISCFDVWFLGWCFLCRWLCLSFPFDLLIRLNEWSVFVLCLVFDKNGDPLFPVCCFLPNICW